ncbi:MAG: class II glutamine amidotransferase [Ignavibacteria bacterium]
MSLLFSLNFNKLVSPSASFSKFRKRSGKSFYGFGIAFYPDRAVQVVKEPFDPSETPRGVEFLKAYKALKTEIFMAYIGWTQKYEKSNMNVQPFHRELYGKEYAFIHNGEVRNCELPPGSRFMPVGDTDSEYAFCYLLDRIAERQVEVWDENQYKWLHNVLSELNNFGELNCIFSEGTKLFCYYDCNGFKNLYYKIIKAPFDNLYMKVDEFSLELEKEKSPAVQGYVVSTDASSGSDWIPLEKGELIVFSGGEKVFSSHREYLKQENIKLTEKETKVLRFIRTSPKRVSLSAIMRTMNFTRDETVKILRNLFKYKLIERDMRYKSWEDDNSLYYTRPGMRKTIDELL